MFAEWVTQGVAFGVKAFFAVFIFAIICILIYGFIALVGAFMGGGADAKENDKRRDSYRG